MTDREDEFDARPELKRKRAQFEFIRNMFVFFGYAFMVSCMIGLVVIGVIGAQSYRVLIDCTEPTGECYEEGQRRSGDVLGRIFEEGRNRELETRLVIIAAVHCSQEFQTFKAIEDCVKERVQTNGG